MLTISWSDQSVTEGSDGNFQSNLTVSLLQFDCVTTETHESTSVLTEHAVESGAPLTDHKRNNPDRITIEAVVTNTPLESPPPFGRFATVGSRFRKVSEIDANVLVFDSEFDRTRDVFNAIKRLKNEAIPLTVETAIETYENAQIVAFSNPRESADGDSLRFAIEIQQIRIAETRTVASPQPREPRGSSRRNRGGQDGESSEERQESTLSEARDNYNERRENGESTLDAALGSIGDTFAGGG